MFDYVQGPEHLRYIAPLKATLGPRTHFILTEHVIIFNKTKHDVLTMSIR